jgi:hypothetical protein
MLRTGRNQNLTFVQETICTIASASGQDLILCDGLAIDEVVKEAFEVLGGDGVITAASHHSCSECTQEYKRSADTIPAAQSGEASAANELTDEITDDVTAETMAVDRQIVTMAVLDGVVMGPSVSLIVICLKPFF